MNYRFETNAIRAQIGRSNFLEHSFADIIFSDLILNYTNKIGASFAELKGFIFYTLF